MVDYTEEELKRCFHSKITKTGGCWLWTGALNSGHYGAFFLKKVHRAHRFSWELYNGPIPERMHVLHKCDNPPCVNPEHLFLGTAKDNTEDKIKKRRASYGRKLSKRDADFIRGVYQNRVTYGTLAKTFGVSREAIARIVRGDTYLHED